MSTYSDKLKSPKWQKKRLEILQRDKFTCFNCGDKERTLHVHHESYINGKEPWDYPDEYLTTICDICHKNTHALKTEFEKFAYRVLMCRDRDAEPEIRLSMRSIIHLQLSGIVDSEGCKIKRK